MVYQDNKRVQTAEELRKMYNLDNLSKDRRAISNNTNSLTKVENEQNNILKSIIINVGDNLENQGEISLWFFNGTPTLETSPSITWETDEVKNEHIGDIYYDRDTGYVYMFEKENEEFIWKQNNDKAIIQAMSLTNAEIDTANTAVTNAQSDFAAATTKYDKINKDINDTNKMLSRANREVETINKANKK